MKERPLLSFTVCWVAGSAAACLISGNGLLLAWAGLILLLVSLRVWGTVSWKYIAMLCLSISLAAGYWEWNEARNISGIPEALGSTIAELNESPVEARGTIISVVERDGDRVDFIMKLLHMNLLAEGDDNSSDPLDGQDSKMQGS